MATKIEFVNALLACCARVYVANQSPAKPVFPLLLYEQTQDAPVLYADNKPCMQKKGYWVYLYAKGSLASLETTVGSALRVLGYEGRLIRESTNGDVISKIKEYTNIEEVE